MTHRLTFYLLLAISAALSSQGMAKTQRELKAPLAERSERLDFLFSLGMMLSVQVPSKLHPSELDRLLPARDLALAELSRRLSVLYNKEIRISCAGPRPFIEYSRILDTGAPLALHIEPNSNGSTWVTMVGYQKEKEILVNDSKSDLGQSILTAEKILSSCSAKVSESKDPFSRLAASVNALVALPDDFAETGQVKQKDVSYHRAWKHKSKKFEIRVRIDDMRPMLAEKKRLEETGTGKMVDPNKATPHFFQAMLMNISQSDNINMNAFPAEAVRQEFNADSGMTAMVKGNSDFSRGYSHVLANFVQRDGTGVIYIFFLFDSPEEAQKLIQQYFYVAKFASR